MSGKRKQPEDSGTKVPAYIVTFSDMVTLLLTFFVLLLTLANVQDPELYDKGRGSFWRSLQYCGLGMLPGAEAKPDFGEVKVKYQIRKQDDVPPPRTIDAKEEDIRKIFKKIRQARMLPSQIVAKKAFFSTTNIRFAVGDATLNESAKKFLREFCMDLQQSTSANAIKLYVLGLAVNESTENQQWLISASRARAVSDYLRTLLPEQLNWPVYSWGAGPGGVWVAQDSPVYKQSQILIAVLRQDE